VTKLLDEKVVIQLNYWRNGANDDLTSAREIIAKSGRYGAGLFYLHLSVEKILKALFVHKAKEFPPFSHNLLSLARKCNLELSKSQETNLAIINEFNLMTRYPDDRDTFLQKITAEYAADQLKAGIEIFEWIAQHLDR
jgi:HEPN domain-containing protein